MITSEMQQAEPPHLIEFIDEAVQAHTDDKKLAILCMTTETLHTTNSLCISET